MDVVIEEVESLRFTFEELDAEYQATAVGNRLALVDRFHAILASTDDSEDTIKLKETAIYRISR